MRIRKIATCLTYFECVAGGGAPSTLSAWPGREGRRLAVLGSVARGIARPDSDIDLLVQTSPGTTSFDFLRFKQLLERVLGRQVDLIDYGALKPVLDDDIRREAALL